jgi:drug/metabolite transporter (DMT)-like permease
MRSTELSLSASINTSAPLRSWLVLFKLAGPCKAAEAIFIAGPGIVEQKTGTLDQAGSIFAMIRLKSNARARPGVARRGQTRSKKSGPHACDASKLRAMLSNHARGLLITASGVLVISPDGLLTRLIGADHWTMIFWRALLLSFGMWLVLGFTCPNRVWKQYCTLRGAALLKVFAYSLGTISFIFAITHTSVANTLVILSTTPLFAAIISRVLLRETIEARTLVAILAAAIGVAVIAYGSGEDESGSLLGDMVALAGAFFLACGFSFVRRFPQASTFAAISVSGLLTAALVFPLAAPLSISPADMGYLMLMGIYMLPLGTALMFAGPRYIPAPEVGLLLLLESVLGPVWVWLALGEAPPGHTLAGGAIVLSTLALNAAWALRRNRDAMARGFKPVH